MNEANEKGKLIDINNSSLIIGKEWKIAFCQNKN
jgi:hypothetical protein